MIVVIVVSKFGHDLMDSLDDQAVPFNDVMVLVRDVHLPSPEGRVDALAPVHAGKMGELWTPDHHWCGGRGMGEEAVVFEREENGDLGASIPTMLYLQGKYA